MSVREFNCVGSSFFLGKGSVRMGGVFFFEREVI